MADLKIAASDSSSSTKFQKVRLQSAEEGPWYAPITHSDCIYIPNQSGDLPLTWVTSIVEMNQPPEPNDKKVHGIKLQYSNQDSPSEIKTLVIYPEIKIQDSHWWINGKDTGQPAMPGIQIEVIK